MIGIIDVTKTTNFHSVDIDVNGVKQSFEIESCYLEDTITTYKANQLDPICSTQLYIRLLLIVRDKNGNIQARKRVYDKKIGDKQKPVEFFIRQWANLKAQQIRMALNKNRANEQKIEINY